MAYQTLAYGFIVRMVMHMSVVAIPWLMNQEGFRLYDNIHLGYTPGHLWLGAWLDWLIPNPALRLRLGMSLVAALSLLIVFRLARQWWGEGAGLIAAATYTGWGLLIMDHALYFEVMMGFYTLVAVWCWYGVETPIWRIFLAGLLSGGVVITKNYGVIVPVAFVLWRLAGSTMGNRQAAFRDLFAFGVGVALLPLVVAGVLLNQGLLDRALYMATAAIGDYAANWSRWLSGKDLLLLPLWLLFVPSYLVTTMRGGDFWGKRAMLLLLVFLMLLAPVYPRYGRFHLSGAVPFVALMTAGSLAMLWKNHRQSVRVAATVGLSAALLIAFLLPIYYRVKLGPLNGELDPHYPLAAWVREETQAPPETAVWILPDVDPTDNFYPVSGYLPPDYWMQAYFFDAIPGVAETMMAAVKANPPAYAVVINHWNDQIPVLQSDFLEQYYTVVSTTEMPNLLHTVTLYQYGP